MSPQTHPGDDTRPSRRAALRWGALGVGTLTGASLTGCALNNPLAGEKTPAAEAVRDLAPDVAVAVRAVTAIRAAQQAVAETARRHPALAPVLGDLPAMHQAHLDRVVEAVPDRVDTSPSTGPAYVVPARAARARARVAASEQSLHDELVGLALRAESGPFARLLGSMAAAVSQRLVGLAS